MNARLWRGVLVVVCVTGCARVRMVQQPIPDYDRYSSAQHSDFGVVYEEGGSLEDARRQYAWAVQKSDTNHVAWTNLGNVAAKMGDVEAAHRAWLRALEIHPGYGPAVLNRAGAMMDVNDREGRQWLREQRPSIQDPRWRREADVRLSVEVD